MLEARQGKRFKPSGRPRTPLATINLVRRMAEENARWGYRRIVGELKKLGISVATTTVRNILKQGGHHPLPGKAFKKPAMPWTQFLHANMDALVGCDFFTKRVYTMRGILTAYVLVFIHVGSRKVFCSPPTYHPDGEWVMQQARNASMWLQDEELDVRYVIHDRDRKYPKVFREFWRSEDARCIPIPVGAPKANAFTETFGETLKRECWNNFMCFSTEQLRHINSEWLDHYNNLRPHRGVGRDNTVLDKTFVPMSEGTVRSRTRLGGLIREYYREAA